MTNPHGDAAINAQRSGSDQVRDGASQNAFGEVLKEQMSSDSGKWNAKQKEEPHQLVFSDPYKNIDGVRGLMQRGTTGDGMADANSDGIVDANSDGKTNRRVREFRGMSLDAQGKYEFKQEDTVWGMAEKLARHAAKGDSPNTEDTIRELNKLLEANKELYPGLDQNPAIIKPGMKLEIPAKETFNITSDPRGELGMNLSDNKMSVDDQAWMNFIGNDPEEKAIKVPEKNEYRPYSPTPDELAKLADEVRFLRGGALGSEIQQMKPAHTQPRQNRKGFAGTTLPPLSAR